MWSMQREDTGVKINLLANTEYKIGTQPASNDLPSTVYFAEGDKKDSSISRKHAIVTVTFDVKNQDKTDTFPELTLKDFKSKYGTYLNTNIDKNVKIKPEHGFKIRSNDRVRFGLQWNIWKFEVTPLIVTTSSLTDDVRNQVKKNIFDIGGHIIDTFTNDCTSLTIDKIKMNPKVVSALALGIPIVTPDYWQSFINSAKIKKKGNENYQDKSPDFKEFLPDITEKFLKHNDKKLFYPDNTRKNLFAGKLFLCSSSVTHKRLSSCIVMAGGEIKNLSDCKLNMTQKLSNKVIVIQRPNDAETQAHKDEYDLVKEKLQAKKKRVIPEYEIGLAILYNSIEKNCNPLFIDNLILGKTNTDDSEIKTQKILAFDTQDTAPMDFDRNKRKVIEESVATESVEEEDACVDIGERSSKRLRVESISEQDTVATNMSQDSPYRTEPVSLGPALTVKGTPGDLRRPTPVIATVNQTNTIVQETFNSSSCSISMPKRKTSAPKSSKDDPFGFGDSNVSSLKSQLFKNLSKKTATSSSVVTETNDNENQNKRPIAGSSIVEAHVQKRIKTEIDSDDPFNFNQTRLPLSKKIITKHSDTSVASTSNSNGNVASTSNLFNDNIAIRPASKPSVFSTPSIIYSQSGDDEWIDCKHTEVKVKTEPGTIENNDVNATFEPQFAVEFVAIPKVRFEPVARLPQSSTQKHSVFNVKLFKKAAFPQNDLEMPVIISSEKMRKCDFRTGELAYDEDKKVVQFDDDSDDDTDKQSDWIFDGPSTNFKNLKISSRNTKK